MSEGDIVVFFGLHGRQLGQVVDIPKRKTSQIKLIADPGKGSVYQAVWKFRAELKTPTSGDDVAAARKRIKRARDSGEGLETATGGKKNEAVRPGSEQRPGDVPSREHGHAPATQAPQRVARWGSSYWNGAFERYMTGSAGKWAKGMLRQNHPRYWLVYYRHEGLGMSMAEIAVECNATERAVRQCSYMARVWLRKYIIEYWELNPDERPDPKYWAA